MCPNFVYCYLALWQPCMMAHLTCLRRHRRTDPRSKRVIWRQLSSRLVYVNNKWAICLYIDPRGARKDEYHQITLLQVLISCYKPTYDIVWLLGALLLCG